MQNVLQPEKTSYVIWHDIRVKWSNDDDDDAGMTSEIQRQAPV